MRRRIVCAMACLVVLAWASAARGQIESHYLPAEWPMRLLPKAVRDLPNPGTTELSVPLMDQPAPPAADPPAAAAEQGKPDATRLSDMCTGPKAVVQQAFKGEHEAAAEAGRKLLERSKACYRDFTWDYLGSATAWSLIQLGRHQDAVDAHRATASRITDADVRQYHLRAIRVILSALKPEAERDKDHPKPEDLKTPGTLRAALRKGLKDEVKQIRKSIEILKSARSVAPRIGNVETAYGKLRLVMAVDPETASGLLGDYKAAADTLVTDVADKLAARTEAQHRKVARIGTGTTFRKRDIKPWNNEVMKLWELVRGVKRVCRVHNYLGRLNLVGTADAAGPFNRAHDCLFAAGRGGDVYKVMGARVPYHSGGSDKVGGTDMRRRAPFSEVFGNP